MPFLFDFFLLFANFHPQERIKSELYFHDAIICILNYFELLTFVLIYSLLLPWTIIHLIASAFLELFIHYIFTTFRACLKANWSYAASCSFFTETRQLIIIFLCILIFYIWSFSVMLYGMDFVSVLKSHVLIISFQVVFHYFYLLFWQTLLCVIILC